MGASVSSEWLWVGLSEVQYHLKICSLWGFYAAYNDWTNIPRCVKSQKNANLLKRHSVPSNIFHFYSIFLSSLFLPWVQHMDFFCSFGWMTFVLIAQNGAGHQKCQFLLYIQLQSVRYLLQFAIFFPSTLAYTWSDFRFPHPWRWNRQIVAKRR